MPYPPAPWILEGYGFQTLHLLDVDLARRFVPSDLQIIQVLPGKTLGGVYLVYYSNSPVEAYNELIIVSGIVTHAGKVGAWISHLYVDNPNSVEGGRNIWGLPKELAQFRWNLEGFPQVHVSQNDLALCTLTCARRSPSLNLPLAAPVLSQLDSKVMLFSGHGKFNLQLIGSTLDVPSSSPFSPLNFGRSGLSFYSNPLKITVEPPHIV
ncbi:acetoacetate decarboxylase family protein [Leptolyngbyaceae cyanobacterium UHCC 1019]